VRRAYEQNPAAVRKWLEEEYPAIREQARQFKAQIHWLDEMGLRSDHVPQGKLAYISFFPAEELKSDLSSWFIADLAEWQSNSNSWMT
jgi:hypothetical protein